MSELRQDPVTRDWVIVNPQRAQRPHDAAGAARCPFCPGNEHLTPPLDQTHQNANHWFIDLLPRLTTPAGSELGSRIVVDVQTPEGATSELRTGIEQEGRVPWRP